MPCSRLVQSVQLKRWNAASGRVSGKGHGSKTRSEAAFHSHSLHRLGLVLVCFLLVTSVPALAAVRTFDVTNFDVVGDGRTLNTAAFQKAIDTCSADGGGKLVIPAGKFVTGTIELKDNVTLHLDEGAEILGSTNAADYRNVDPFIDGTGAELGYALIVALGAHHVGLEGQGAIDGRGLALKATQAAYTIRPFLVRWVRCDGVDVEDVQLRNSGAWTMHFFQSQNASVSRVTIRSLGLANNDGIDIDSCDHVRIMDCDIDTGDDAICLKATSAKPCSNINVTGCKLRTRCNSIKFGTESMGNFEHIRISRCQIRDTRMNGIALFSVDGSHLHDVEISDIEMDGITVAINLRLGSRLRTFRTGDQQKTPGLLRDVTLKNIHVKGARQIGLLINGVPGHCVENLTLENIQIELAGGGTVEDARIQLPENEKAYPEYNTFGKVMPASGIYARHVRNVTFKNVRTSVLAADARPAVIFVDVENVVPADFLAASTTPSTPARP